MSLKVFKDLAQRRILRYLVGYLAAAWVALEVVDQLADNGVLPAVMYRATLSLAACGVPGAVVVAWFHGAKGRQVVSRMERGLLAFVAVFAVAVTTLVVRADLVASPGAAAAELPPEADPSRIAVLYFEPRGGEDADFLATGLTEALIDKLSGVAGLHVVSRNGSQLFRGVTVSPDSVGRALRAGTIVSGTVTQAGDRVRVSVGLENAYTGDQYASKPFERARAEIFTLQDELADTVSVFLRRAVGTQVGEVRLRAETRSVEAWELVQRSQQATLDGDSLVAGGDIERGSRMFAGADSVLAQAEAADPAWIEPIVRRGWLAYHQSRLAGMDRSMYPTWIEAGLGHANRALAKNPKNANALDLRATLVYWKYLLNLAGTPDEGERLKAEAEAGFRAAIAADATRATALTSLSHLLLNRGETAEAKLAALRAYETDPFLENANLTLWRIFTSSWSLQDGVEAKRYCEEGVRRFTRDYRFKQCQLMLFALPGITPDIPRGWTFMQEFTELSPPQVREVNRARGFMYMGMALTRAGMPDSARAVLRQGRAGPNIDPLRETALFESIARTWLKDFDEAVRQLGAYFAANPGALEGYRSAAERGEMVWYHQDLLNEPRFRSLVGLQ